MIKEFQKTLLVCYNCGNTHTIIPLREGVNYYELTYCRDKGVGSDIFFNKDNQLKCRECLGKEFHVRFEILEVHTPNEYVEGDD